MCEGGGSDCPTVWQLHVSAPVALTHWPYRQVQAQVLPPNVLVHAPPGPHPPLLV
jgi:hypothetical protein